MAWRIERINPSAPDLCRRQFGGKCCGYRIAKYKRSTAAPTFTGIQRKNGRKGTKQKQFWFCPTDVTRCVMGQTRCVVHYPDILEMWPVKVGMNLTQIEVERLEFAGSKLMMERKPWTACTNVSLHEMVFVRSNGGQELQEIFIQQLERENHFVLFPNLHRSILQEWTEQRLLNAPS
jgi:hypothetical protein